MFTGGVDEGNIIRLEVRGTGGTLGTTITDNKSSGSSVFAQWPLLVLHQKIKSKQLDLCKIQSRLLSN